MDLTVRERGGGMFIRDGWISRRMRTNDCWRAPIKIVDSPAILMPGFVNGHHHLYQTLDRLSSIPERSAG
jgi:cytosine/adenosine deaminase-related metal-dependent hydrolase